MLPEWCIQMPPGWIIEVPNPLACSPLLAHKQLGINHD